MAIGYAHNIERYSLPSNFKAELITKKVATDAVATVCEELRQVINTSGAFGDLRPSLLRARGKPK